MPLRHLTLLAVLAAFPAGGVVAQASCPAGPTALVLSGGGAKGLAHIGVLLALDEAGIRPDLVVGTSMGAVVGALAATGYRASQVDSIARSFPLAALFRASEPRGPAAWGTRLPLVIWEEGERGFAPQGATIQQATVNAILNAVYLRGNLIARGDFDRLPVPLRVVATDLATRDAVVIARGDLAQAVRASIAIPLVFTPEQIGDLLLTDGGLSANIPVGIARAAGAGRVIVSDVTEAPSDSINLQSPFVVAERLLDWLFQQPADSLGPGDVLVRTPVEGFRTLDFSRNATDSLIALGRAAARAALADWPCRSDSTAAPAAPAVGPVPVVRVGRAEGDDEGLRLLRRTLELEPNTTVTPTRLMDRLLRLGDRELFREVWLHPTTRDDGVAFEPVLRRLPRRVGGIGLAYDNELGGRAWGGFVDRRVPVLQGEASALLTLSRFDSRLLLELRRQTLLGQPNFTPVASLELRDGEVRRFTENGVALPGVDHGRAEAAAGVERQLAFGVRLRVVGLVRTWRDEDLVTGDRLVNSTWGGSLRLQRLTTDRHSTADLAVTLTESYALATLELRLRTEIGAVGLHQVVRAGIGRDLPTSEALPLGGLDGFPGLRPGERLGDNELFTSLTATHPFIGPLHLRLSGAFGRTAYGATTLRDEATPGGQIHPGFHLPGDLLGPGGWLVGGRLGVGSETPLGPVRLEWGVNDRGGTQFFLRVGRWD